MPGLRGHLPLDPRPFLQLICTLSENTDHICMYTYRSEKVRNLILTSVADRQEMGNRRLEPGRDPTIRVDEVPLRFRATLDPRAQNVAGGGAKLR